VLRADYQQSSYRRDLRFDAFVPGRPVTHSRQGLPHVKALDGLRGLAVVGVVLYHLDLPWMKGGFLGVSLFFTLSGFLITSLLLAEEDRVGSIDFTTFWVRRFRRLLPAAWAGILLAVLYCAVAGEAEQLRRLPGDVVASLGEVANWRFIFANDSYTATYQAPSPLLHYWSLAIEEQFYLIFPVLVAFLVRRRASHRTWGIIVGVLMAGSAVATVVLYDPRNTTRVYFSSFARAGELLAGVGLAIALHRWWTRPTSERAGRWLSGTSVAHTRLRAGAPVAALVVTLILWVTVGTDQLWLYQGGFFAIAALSCVLVLGVIVEGPVATILGSRPLVVMGLISYGVYVYHWILFQWIDTAHTGLDGLTLTAVRLTATLVVAVGSYRYLERPIRRGLLHFGPRMAWMPVALVLTLVGTSVFLNTTASQRAVANARSALARPLATQPPTRSATAAAAPSAPPVGPPRKVLIMGDSLVHQALDVISDDLAQQGTQVMAIGAPGQTLLTHQAQWTQDLRRALDSFKPDVVVLESCCGHYDPTDAFVEAGRPLAVDSDALWRVWERTVDEVVRTAGETAPAVMWTLIPPARTNGFYGPIEQRIAKVNQVTLAMAQRHPDLQLLDWRVVSGPAGEFVESLPDASGKLVPVRAADGLHFADAGKKIIADLTRAGINDAWQAANARRQGKT
jgi:peptidoglycan/LPS O-acetylase OafA/YrhL